MPHVLFFVRSRENRNTGQSPTKRMFGQEIKTPGDWQLRLPEEFPDAGKFDPEFAGADRNPSVEFDNSPMKSDNASVEEGLVVPSPEATSTHIPSEFPVGRICLLVGD